MTVDFYNDVFDDLINRNSPEAKEVRRASIAYTHVREVVDNIGPMDPDDARSLVARERLANAERALYVASLTLAIKVVGR
jgi:hypothetical protein